MRTILVAVMVLAPAVAFCAGEVSAPHGCVPPVTDKSAAMDELHPIPQEVVAEYLTHSPQLSVFDTYAGQAAALKAAQAPDRVLQVGAGFAVDLDSTALFGPSFVDGEYTVFQAAIVSVEADALRLIVDLSALAEGDEVWVIDSTGLRAFGPYTAADQSGDSRWLPVIEGDTAVLMARSLIGTAPAVRLVGVSHFYQGFHSTLKVLSCNINIACEQNATIQAASTGVGIIVVPQYGYDAALCTGALINNADTANYEPYFLTSWHCVPDGVDADDVDVIWDYRAATCGSTSVPSLSSLPRSSGEVLLTTSGTYDASLLRLGTVSSGTYGRSYLGWTTAKPAIGDAVVSIHYPLGSYMRISYGSVVSTDNSVLSTDRWFSNQTKVHWSQGVTEKGSSGSPLLLARAGYTVIGTLSSGATHSCTDTSGNVDYYSSFRHFYSQVEGWLTGTNPPDPDDTNDTTCPAEKSFAQYPQVLMTLRAYRDTKLDSTDLGKQVIEAYYRAAPYMAQHVEHSSEARAAFMAFTAPFTGLGRQAPEEQGPSAP